MPQLFEPLKDTVTEAAKAHLHLQREYLNCKNAAYLPRSPVVETKHIVGDRVYNLVAVVPKRYDHGLRVARVRENFMWMRSHGGWFMCSNSSYTQSDALWSHQAHIQRRRSDNNHSFELG